MNHFETPSLEEKLPEPETKDESPEYLEAMVTALAQYKEVTKNFINEKFDGDPPYNVETVHLLSGFEKQIDEKLKAYTQRLEMRKRQEIASITQQAA